MYEQACPNGSELTNTCSGLPSNDLAAYYSDDSGDPVLDDDLETYNIQPRLAGNRGIKRTRGAKFQRRGKIAAWTPTMMESLEDQRIKKRLKVALKIVLPSAAAEAGVPLDPLEVAVVGDPEERDDVTLPHLRSPSPPPTTYDISESLSEQKMTTYLDLVTSPAVKNTLGEASKEKALMRTVDELIDGENPLLTALGRFKAELQACMKRTAAVNARDGPSPDAAHPMYFKDPPRNYREEIENPHLYKEETERRNAAYAAYDAAAAAAAAAASSSSVKKDCSENAKEKETASAAGDPVIIDGIPPKTEEMLEWEKSDAPAWLRPRGPNDSDTMFMYGDPFLLPPHANVTYLPSDVARATKYPHVKFPPVALTPLQQIFVTPQGLDTTIGPGPSDPRLQLPPTHPGYPHTTEVRLTPLTQKVTVTAALEKIYELSSDVSEYVARLQEIRERIANIARARRRVWQVVRERAVTENGEVIGDGEADGETMKLRAEAEQAMNGTTVETRRRRGVATAVASAVAAT